MNQQLVVMIDNLGVNRDLTLEEKQILGVILDAIKDKLDALGVESRKGAENVRINVVPRRK